ncbi:MAG: RsmE family RNA methyltransferase [Acidobacteriota bacterium]|nr:RsmE family RNA methyltransferase [Acidobacteriota bacterium]
MITLVVPPGELTRQSLEVAGDSYRHLFRSRRLARGAELRLVDGEGQARSGEVVEIGRRSARVELGPDLPARDPRRRVRLLVAPPRSTRASWLVEKATELGVAEIFWLNAERSPREMGDGGLERLRRVAVAALEQCHGARLPQLAGPFALDRLGSLLEGCPHRFYLHPEASSQGLPRMPEATDAAAFAIGPEGGWTDAETAALEAAGCLPRGLGERVLRVETAAVAVASLALLQLD